MKIFKTVTEMESAMRKLRDEDRSIGFVPTMGALHEGHLSLIRQAKAENDIAVCSIFVNPIQFNNPDDLAKYPQQIEKDIQMLEEIDCDYLFNPDVDEMYPEPDTTEFDFGYLEQVMEGVNRPGHFRGVAVVVKRLFEIIKPHRAYFGKKDYQQLLIVKSLVEQYNLTPEIIACAIVREKDGLAMSSRNKRLSFSQRRKAPAIYANLQKAKELREYLSPEQIKHWMYERYSKSEDFALEYFEVADADSLQPIENWEDSQRPMGFIVVHMGAVRLLDNIEFF
jgi:pantoate--beta-alanine ligase